ncbi:replication endonuclease [Hafnia paralvei]|uniref:replication endonuclease n=1 Tax=Hafnia paralvei TaxID=546367 RepID=UPI0020321AF9|nr:replication endonuclease [Hafnia paralvei]
MTASYRGRVAPTLPPAFNAEPRAPFVGAYSWNAPREAIGKERPLTREEYLQGQDALRKIDSLPYFLSKIFIERHNYLLNTQGILAAHRFLYKIYLPRIHPRLEFVNTKFDMDVKASLRFLSELEIYRGLPDMHDKELKRLAGRIAAQLYSAYEELSDAFLESHEQEALFTDEAQVDLYAHVAGAARAFNITPMHWQRFRKGKLDMRGAFRSIMRLINDDWWIRKLKAQRTQWREALLIAAGEVNFKRSSYASKQAISDVRARRAANMEYLKGCDLENVETGERIDLIDKVMASISNPEIRRMELMSTIYGIGKYAAEKNHIGMFVTITTPSKYHPTRTVKNKRDKQCQLNHKWDGEAFSPKDGQRYLVGIWSKMRTAFKDRDLNVYGIRVVEPHHDGTPHWHMVLFCDRKQRAAIVEIMQRYALKEDGDERGARKQRFECKHLNKGGAVAYIAKYVSKNIDGYALDGEIDHDTGKPLSQTAAAVTAWASIWRIPQFHPIGIPTMGAYRECRRQSLRGISIADSFDESVEAVRAAADSGDFAAYIEAQGGANVARDLQTVRVAREIADELNEYDEEVPKVVGIFAPHLGENHIHKTRETQWRIVSKAVDLDPLTLKSASGAPRSPVNNCGEGQHSVDIKPEVTPSEYAAAVMQLVESGDVSWTDWDVAKTLRDAAKAQTPKINLQQRSANPNKPRDLAPSARLTRSERGRTWQISRDLAKEGITAQRWELEALARGATVSFDDKVFSYPALDEWPGFSDIEESLNV